MHSLKSSLLSSRPARRLRSLTLALPILFAVTAPLSLSSCGYNTIQSYDEQAEQAKKNIDAQLQRRADLIGNLVATVKGLAQQESDVFIGIAKARAGLTGALSKAGGSDPAETAAANEQLTTAMRGLSVVIEAYPQLKSDQGFLKLQDELTGTENRIAVARTDYNSTVRTYNEYIRKFPAVVTAKATGAKPRTYFEVTDAAARSAPTVDFSKPKAN